jgi:TolA-binding protein
VRDKIEHGHVDGLERNCPITLEEVRMRFVVAPVVMASFLLAASIAPVHAQVDSREGIALQNQIYQLRQELKAVEDQASRGGSSGSRSQVYAPPPPQNGASDLLAQLLTRVDSLEEQVRQLRGRIDETQNQLQRQRDDLGKRIDDLAFQINPQAAQPLTPPSAYPSQGPAPSQPVQPPPPRTPGPHTPEMALQEGNAALARRDYPNAEAAAREVLANRTSPRAYDARLLLAQALYGERQFAQAAIAFDDSYNSSHKGTHAQDALLGLAGSLSAINEKKAACDTLTRLHTDFPQPRADIAAGATATGQKAGCH